MDLTLTPHARDIQCLSFNPTLNLDFGGSHGERLPRLTRIVAHLYDRLVPFVGLTFYFEDEVLHFGRQGSMEASSFIDGPREELISSVRSEKSVKSGKVVSLRVLNLF